MWDTILEFVLESDTLSLIFVSEFCKISCDLSLNFVDYPVIFILEFDNISFHFYLRIWPSVIFVLEFDKIYWNLPWQTDKKYQNSLSS